MLTVLLLLIRTQHPPDNIQAVHTWRHLLSRRRPRPHQTWRTRQDLTPRGCVSSIIIQRTGLVVAAMSSSNICSMTLATPHKFAAYQQRQHRTHGLEEEPSTQMQRGRRPLLKRGKREYYDAFSLSFPFLDRSITENSYAPSCICCIYVRRIEKQNKIGKAK